MNQNSRKTIIFDLGNVLFDINIPKAFHALQQLVLPKYNTKKWMELWTPILNKYETGKISTELFVNYILKHSKQNVQALDVILAWNSMLIEMPQSRINILKSISQQYDLFLLSNINDLHYKYFISSLSSEFSFINFERLFIRCYYSHLIGLRKPDSEPFQLIIDQNNLDINTTIFVDDNLDNVNTASQLGLQTLHIDPLVINEQLKANFL